MEIIDGKPKKLIYANLKPEEITFKKVLRVLDGKYGDDEVLELAKAKELFNESKRSNQPLLEFLDEYDLLRTEAMRCGHVPSANTDGLDLISACDLAPQVHSGVMVDLTKKGGTKPSYKLVRKLLKIIARTEGLKKLERETRKKKNEKATLMAKGPGKGVQKTAIEKEAGQKWWPKKTKGTGKGGGKGGSTAQIPCTFWAAGRCDRGDKCTFKHVSGKGAGATAGPWKAQEWPEWKDGDWECSSQQCKAHNFAKNEKCFKCDAPRTGGGKGEHKKGQKGKKGDGKSGTGKNSGAAGGKRY